MKLAKTIFTFALAFQFLVSCNKSDLTKEELMEHLDVLWWRMKVPDDISKIEKQYLGLRFISSDEPQSVGGGSSGWKPGEEVKILISHLEDERIRYSVIGENSQGHGSIPNKALGYTVSVNIPNGALVQPGDMLIKLANKSSISHSKKLNEGEIGITVNWNSIE